MNKILFLSRLDFYGKKILEYEVDVISPYKSIWSVFKLFRILHLNSNLKFKSIWYKKIPNLKEYDTVILSANEFSVALSHHLEKKEQLQNKRLIFWYWNPVKPKYAPNCISDNWEKWTFDKIDSVHHNLFYNGTYYFPISIPNYGESSTDIFFIGQDKGRYSKLKQLERELNLMGLKTEFHIVNEKKTLSKNKKYQRKLPYELVLKKISQSKTILEVMQENQTGLTLRTMESLNFEKKLITTNKTIKNYTFYRKENIFILDSDSIEKLPEFCNTPYKKVPKHIVEQYHFDKWKNRLLNHIELNDYTEKNFYK